MASSCITVLKLFFYIDLVLSATLFREAAGVYHHLSHDVLSSLQSANSVQRPPEATSSVATVMSLICLAEAQVSVLSMLLQLHRRPVSKLELLSLLFGIKV